MVPQVGLAIAEGESALFRWSGLVIPSKRQVGFGADKENHSVLYSNDTGHTTSHVVTLDRAAVDYARMVYGPFDIPHGADQQIALHNWPDVAEVTSIVDIDRDGNPDRTDIIRGEPLPTPKISALALTHRRNSMSSTMRHPMTDVFLFK